MNLTLQAIVIITSQNGCSGTNRPYAKLNLTIIGYEIE